MVSIELFAISESLSETVEARQCDCAMEMTRRPPYTKRRLVDDVAESNKKWQQG